MYLIGGLTIPFLGTTLGAAMVFLMRGVELAKEKYGLPAREPSVWTHFVR